ncbi:LytR/AlgR family response regulator transcription factor [Portibacter marinus]|uniref:LytR/AlgR family response regulator transcription factor n=1 Tax=Portibacter marinus TaxID=2898660 RepID=UPI001F38DBB1|nr:LytTR family DNA-binding domain-containing protein [Portibacter marinus]
MKAVIVEDSRLARKELMAMIREVNIFSDLIEVADGAEAVNVIQKVQPDVIFLDIHLPGMNGFEVLEALDFVPPVIFTTAFDEYAIKSFEYNAVDYLMKPIRKERLEKAISKLNHSPTEQDRVEKISVDQQIFVRDGEKCWFVKVSDIRLFESVGNYTRIYFDDEKPLVLKSLSYLEGILDDQRFFRANRQQIMNVHFVDKISTGFNGKLKIILVTGEEVMVSRRQSAEFKTLFSL